MFCLVKLNRAELQLVEMINAFALVCFRIGICFKMFFGMNGTHPHMIIVIRHRYLK